MTNQRDIPVYKIGWRRPEHNEEVVWYKRQSSFGYYGFEPIFTKAEYHWQDDECTGCCYNGEDEEEMYKDGWKLFVLFDGHLAGADDMYTPLDEWERVLDD